ncbi:hypothetical protein MMC15_003271 [Xylographa vitiligo]|nr:hypothetical protein [Xylographa vitiligo]
MYGRLADVHHLRAANRVNGHQQIHLLGLRLDLHDIRSLRTGHERSQPLRKRQGFLSPDPLRRRKTFAEERLTPGSKQTAPPRALRPRGPAEAPTLQVVSTPTTDLDPKKLTPQQASATGSASPEAATPPATAISRPAEIGAIVGATCGAVLLLGLGAFAARRLSRRRRATAKFSAPTRAELDHAAKAEEGPREVGAEEVRPELEEGGRVCYELVGEGAEERGTQELRGHEFSQELDVPVGRERERRG